MEIDYFEYIFFFLETKTAYTEKSEVGEMKFAYGFLRLP